MGGVGQAYNRWCSSRYATLHIHVESKREFREDAWSQKFQRIQTECSLPEREQESRSTKCIPEPMHGLLSHISPPEFLF